MGSGALRPYGKWRDNPIWYERRSCSLDFYADVTDEKRAEKI